MSKNGGNKGGARPVSGARGVRYSTSPLLAS